LSLAAVAQQVNPQLYSGLRWRMIGPFRGGRSIAVSGVENQPNVFYFGAVGGGVWKSNNGGETWIPIFDGQPIASIGALAVAQSDPNVIYVGTGEADFRSDLTYGNGVYKSTDAGKTWTRLTCPSTSGTCVAGQSPFKNTFGDPVALYNKAAGTWFAIFLDAGCGGQGIGGYKSTTPTDPLSWTHFCVHTGSGDDRESGAVDNNPSSAHFGTMYVSWNDFSLGGNLKVTRSTDFGVTWTSVQLASASPFIRDVQATVDSANGNAFVAGMNEGGGGFNTRSNKLYRSLDGGVTWTNTYTGPTFAAPGRVLCPNTYFVCMFSGPPGDWRHMGWGQPAVQAGVVNYVYDQHGASTDPADVYVIRSTDNGATFGTPTKLNTTDTSTKANWQPNLSIDSSNRLVAVWYDEREATATCVKGDETIPCYRMWSAKSNDGGITWSPDAPFSDVVSPLPGQPDSGIIAEYAGDYDYSYFAGSHHLHPWVDGRVLVNSASQQDVFFGRRHQP
jgi:hypothetical protein